MPKKKKLPAAMHAHKFKKGSGKSKKAGAKGGRRKPSRKRSY